MIHKDSVAVVSYPNNHLILILYIYKMNNHQHHNQPVTLIYCYYIPCNKLNKQTNKHQDQRDSYTNSFGSFFSGSFFWFVQCVCENSTKIIKPAAYYVVFVGILLLYCPWSSTTVKWSLSKERKRIMDTWNSFWIDFWLVGFFPVKKSENS